MTVPCWRPPRRVPPPRRQTESNRKPDRTQVFVTVLPEVPERRLRIQPGAQVRQLRLHAEEHRLKAGQHPKQPLHPAAPTTHQPPRNHRIHMGVKKETDRGHLPRRLGNRSDLLDPLQGPPHPAGQTVGQCAERGVAGPAVPAPHPHPFRLHPFVGPVTAHPAPGVQAQKARRRACLPPALPDNILPSGQIRFVSKLNGPSTAHGPATVIARATFFDQFIRSARPSPPPRMNRENRHGPDMDNVTAAGIPLLETDCQKKAARKKSVPLYIR